MLIYEIKTRHYAFSLLSNVVMKADIFTETGSIIVSDSDMIRAKLFKYHKTLIQPMVHIGAT